MSLTVPQMVITRFIVALVHSDLQHDVLFKRYDPCRPATGDNDMYCRDRDVTCIQSADSNYFDGCRDII